MQNTSQDPPDNLEILISTMYRDSLNFLNNMFKNNTLSDYQILIINQTDKEHQLVSDQKNIRVINSFERGLPQSRNMAIKNAIGDICLIADDDVTYVSGFEEKITKAYSSFKDATVITFQMLNEDGELYKKYSHYVLHTQKTIRTVNGVVISFDRKKLLDQSIFYDNNFGLGANFESANEYVFMKNVLKKAKAYFVPQIILSHPNFSSGLDAGSDRVVYARSALHYKYYNWLAYLWVFKYIRFLYWHGYITFDEVTPKLKKGFSGIKKYRQVLKKQNK